MKVSSWVSCDGLAALSALKGGGRFYRPVNYLLNKDHPIESQRQSRYSLCRYRCGAGRSTWLQTPELKDAKVTPLELLSQSLLQAPQDFSAAFMIVNRIQDLLKEEDCRLSVDCVFQACKRVWQTSAYRNQKQAYFLYRSVSDTLQQVMMRALHEEEHIARRALDLLLTGPASPHESLRRAACEGLGMLPLAIDRRLPSEPETRPSPPPALPVLDQDWLAKRNVRTRNGWSWAGRSLRAETRSGAILVVKCLRKGEDPATLQREAAWMRRLAGCAPQLQRPFRVPQPLEHGDGWLVCAPRFLARGGSEDPLHPKGYALAFLAPPDYFDYPNEAAPDRRPGAKAICEVLSRNAYLMGRLTAMGIAHTAPIPLFHNRAQGHRREDEGRYRWPHRGRLDRWLASCRHPNFGASGLRDFEHFAAVAGRRRYEVIGSHLISLLLVAGSYFRQKSPQRVGFDAAGRPVDVRDLFDHDLFKTIVRIIWHGYAEGFIGETPAEGDPPVSEDFVDRMIDEMGVDRHMEEILRVADQEAMSRPMFLAFLQSRGFGLAQAQGLTKGQADIPLMTGPHLGGFNQPISLPELIDFAAAGAAHCVAQRFRRENALENR
jgi:hypothetical protein